MSDTFKLASRLDSAAAHNLAEMLNENRNKAITLDASEVSHCGALAAQVLVAACRQWRSEEVAFSVENPSSGMIECSRLLGIAGPDLGAAETMEAPQ
ncbi:STAS domain-containing protein [Candidatus Rhodobacter oscarellae]|uniref:STAS domain-containing protein n=1 Tax=Candidatus Rhodobacter oscarellae TaxID=1675527 RepID=UPI000A789B04|nr:STAS domain-containing protein [Candidatus Rhodobacter lobularis]